MTELIQQIIEFAKMIPGFMKLSQDDQIVLLKAGKCAERASALMVSSLNLVFLFYISTGSFELCCLRMSRYYDLSTKQVVFGDGLMPMDAFLSQGLIHPHPDKSANKSRPSHSQPI